MSEWRIKIFINNILMYDEIVILSVVQIYYIITTLAEVYMR